MGLGTDGNGSTSIVYVDRNIIRVTAGNNRVADLRSDGADFKMAVTVSGALGVAGALDVVGALSASGDLNVAGGLGTTHVFFRNNLLQAQRTSMTGSAFGTVYYLTEPAVRPGSFLGFAVLGNSAITAGAVSASIMLDGVNVGTPLILDSGTTGSLTFAKDAYTFLAGQGIGVSITGSAEYTTGVATSASFVVTVLAEQ